jgi:hypothetical protein
MARYKTIGMVAQELEMDAFSHQIPYMDAEERKKCIISVRGGRVFNDRGFAMTDKFVALDLSDKTWKAMRSNCLFVMDGGGAIYCAPAIAVEHHSCFLAGQPVASAGIISFGESGFIEHLSPLSGHYRPPRDYFNQVVSELKRRGARLEPNVVQLHGATSSFERTVPNLLRRHETVTDHSDGAEGVVIGTHKAGQTRRLYPSGPKWEWI